MPVTYTATERKNKILELLPNATRIGNGQRWVVDLGNGTIAMIKTNLADRIMVKTDIEDPETATLSGFTDDVTHVLAVTGRIENLSAYLVPIEKMEDIFRSRQREWMDRTGGKNTTWVLSNLNDHFSEYSYRIGESEVMTEGKKLTPDEAKAGLALYFNTAPENINISINY